MDIKEIKENFGDCDWMRATLNTYSVDAVLWLINRVEELEKPERELIAKWFKKGQDSVHRKNQSGHHCIIGNNDKAISAGLYPSELER